jgi:hypothetical protein
MLVPGCSARPVCSIAVKRMHEGASLSHSAFSAHLQLDLSSLQYITYKSYVSLTVSVGLTRKAQAAQLLSQGRQPHARAAGSQRASRCVREHGASPVLHLHRHRTTSSHLSNDLTVETRIAVSCGPSRLLHCRQSARRTNHDWAESGETHVEPTAPAHTPSWDLHDLPGFPKARRACVALCLGFMARLQCVWHACVALCLGFMARLQCVWHACVALCLGFMARLRAYASRRSHGLTRPRVHPNECMAYFGSITRRVVRPLNDCGPPHQAGVCMRHAARTSSGCEGGGGMVGACTTSQPSSSRPPSDSSAACQTHTYTQLVTHAAGRAALVAWKGRGCDRPVQARRRANKPAHTYVRRTLLRVGWRRRTTHAHPIG